MNNYCSSCGYEYADSENFCPKCGQQRKVDSTTPAPAYNTFPSATSQAANKESAQATITYAGFWKRVAAFFIDLTILFVLSHFMGLNSYQADAGTADLISLLIVWLYFASWEASSYQATPGKRVLSIKVTGDDHTPLTFGEATGRHFGKIVSGIILGIGYLMAAFTEKKQALHDLIAGALVVNEP